MLKTYDLFVRSNDFFKFAALWKQNVGPVGRLQPRGEIPKTRVVIDTPFSKITEVLELIKVADADIFLSWHLLNAKISLFCM